jgi:site-specific DNA-methyltransferase (adenine-specific)
MIGDEERISYPRNKPYNQYYGGDRQKPLLKRTIKGHYPNTLLDYKRNFRGDSTRPDEMVEYFIKTYTNEGDKILDLTCYNGLTGRIAKQLNRRYIGVDLRFHSDWVSLSTM